MSLLLKSSVLTLSEHDAVSNAISTQINKFLFINVAVVFVIFFIVEWLLLNKTGMFSLSGLVLFLYFYVYKLYHVTLECEIRRIRSSGNLHGDGRSR